MCRGAKIAMTPLPNTRNICGTCKKNVTTTSTLQGEKPTGKVKKRKEKNLVHTRSVGRSVLCCWAGRGHGVPPGETDLVGKVRLREDGPEPQTSGCCQERRRQGGQRVCLAVVAAAAAASARSRRLLNASLAPRPWTCASRVLNHLVPDVPSSQ